MGSVTTPLPAEGVKRNKEPCAFLLELSFTRTTGTPTHVYQLCVISLWDVSAAGSWKIRSLEILSCSSTGPYTSNKWARKSVYIYKCLWLTDLTCLLGNLFLDSAILPNKTFYFLIRTSPSPYILTWIPHFWWINVENLHMCKDINWIEVGNGIFHVAQSQIHVIYWIYYDILRWYMCQAFDLLD